MTIALRLPITIRAATVDDYAEVARVSNSVYSEYANSVEELRFYDERRDPRCHFARFLAEYHGEAVGLAECGQWSGMFHPHKFFFGVTVLPERQGQGIGAALYDHVMGSLAPCDPISVRTDTRSDWARSLKFLEDRGFSERMRSWESRLAVDTFDFAPYAGVVEGVEASGLALTTFAALASDPERDRKLYELETEINWDVPHSEAITPIDYESYVQRVIENPDLMPDGWFVAVDRATGTYAGMSQLWLSQTSDDLYTGLTGVRRDYRRRGIALALKLKAIAHARSLGRTLVKTWNESNNRAMLSINEQLGFVKQPIWVEYVKFFRADEPLTEPVDQAQAPG